MLPEKQALRITPHRSPEAPTVNAPTVAADDLIPISLATLSLSATAGINVYLRPRPGQPAMLFCSADQQAYRPRIEQLVREGNTKLLFIRGQDCCRYRRTLLDNWQQLIPDPQQPIANRVAALYEVIREVLCQHLDNGSIDSIVESCQTFGQAVVTTLGQDRFAFDQLFTALHHDDALFTHSANVSAYAFVLARGLGWSLEQVQQIAVGGLLHDIGLLEIDQRIYNQRARLEDAQRRIIQSHPTLAMQRLANRQDLSEGQMMMIYQHHERFNGSGYPVGVSDEEIHPWARLCAIVDVFEALTSQRPFRPAVSRATAMSVLERGCGSEFDQEMLACWRQIVSN
jgi:HD-GYP domain-containing protein (c-di-GMP phosphodiesterase class II)